MNNATPKILYPELSYAIIGAAMDVHNELGPGWDEDAYHLAMLHALKGRGLQPESKLRGSLMHKGIVADRFELDVLVENKIVLELKHIVGDFAPSHRCQLINYLKFWRKDIGILINFGLDRLKYERVPYTPVDGTIHYEATLNKRMEAGASFDLVFSILDTILNTHGLGYGTKTYNGLFVAECRFLGIRYEPPRATLSYREHSLGEKQLDAFLINQDILVVISALNGGSSAIDLARLLSYMNQMKIKNGVLANFGKTFLTIRPLIL